MKEIIQKDHPTLRKTAEEIDPAKINSPEIQKIITEMRTALDKEFDGVALAAPQINISKRIFIISPKVNNGLEEPITETVFINPEIIKKSNDKKSMDEGCLSVRPLYGTVKRASRATVKAFNEKFRLRYLFITSLLCFSLALALGWEDAVKAFKEGQEDARNDFSNTEQVDSED